MCHSKKLRGIQFLDPNWLPRNTVGTASVVSFSNYFTLILSHILVCEYRWGESLVLFPVVIFMEGERNSKEIPIFASLFHFFCVFKNAQKQPCVCVLQKKRSLKCCEIYRKSRMLESSFNKVNFAAVLKKDCVFLWIFPNYQGQLLHKKPAGDCFWMQTTGKILKIAGRRFSALWSFSFWMIAFSWTFSWDAETLSSNFLLKSKGDH